MTARGWLPIRFFAHGGEARVDWCRARDVRFEDPFFSQTIERLMRHPFHQAFRRVAPAAELEELPEAPPAALVLHLSRCGSTLVARMLAAARGARVLSEPDPFDAVLRYEEAPEERRAAWLRGLAAAWSVPRGRLFLKLDSASTLDLPLVARAFAGVPRVFLYRDPLEVLVSNVRAGSFWPGNVVLARRSGAHGAPDDIDFAARVLGRYLERAAEDQERGEGTLLVRWEELPEAFFTRVLPHLGVAPSPEELAAMREVSRRDAKSPGKTFVRDSESKRREAGPEWRAAIERHARAPFERLEAFRAARRVAP